jgi:hypothetical protein
MVQLKCDVCNFVCDHTVCGMTFAISWIASKRTKLAYCATYGSKGDCKGVLRSNLTEDQIDSEMKTNGYD